MTDLNRLPRNTRVRFTKNGTTVEGYIVSDRPSWFYPHSTVTKYGTGSMGKPDFGYQVSAPIVQKDGSIYPHGNGIGWVSTRDLEVIR